MTIEEILEELGLALPPDKQEALIQAVEQNYLPVEEHQRQLAARDFDSLLETRIQAAGGRSSKAVRALLDLEALARDPSRQAVDQALAVLKASDGYLFAGLPQVARGTGSTNPISTPDPMAAIYAAAGV